MNSIYWTTVCFGKSEEMEKNFYSIEHHIDISVVKLVFINTDAGMSGIDNVEIFNKYRKKGDRAFLCKGNYWTAPYRYVMDKIIPRDEKISVFTESDVWFTKKTSYFSRGVMQFGKYKNLGLVTILTDHVTPMIKSRFPRFKDYFQYRNRCGLHVMWYFTILSNDLLRDYYWGRGSHRRELSDGKIVTHCLKRNKRALVEDGRDVCIHLDNVATVSKYPYYEAYYKGDTSNDYLNARKKFTKEFACKFRHFNDSCFVEI